MSHQRVVGSKHSPAGDEFKSTGPTNKKKLEPLAVPDINPPLLDLEKTWWVLCGKLPHLPHLPALNHGQQIVTADFKAQSFCLFVLTSHHPGWFSGHLKADSVLKGTNTEVAGCVTSE